MGPDSSDLAQNLPPGLVFHEDSESGLRMGGRRQKKVSKKNNILDQDPPFVLGKNTSLPRTHQLSLGPQTTCIAKQRGSASLSGAI